MECACAVQRRLMRPISLTPPLKTQGGKTRLLGQIIPRLRWEPGLRWIEPFVGGGSVALAVQPERALLCDANPHLVAFFRSVQNGSLTADRVRKHLAREGRLLKRDGAGHYYTVRDRFRNAPTPADFMLLNHTCFNGLMRFNGKGEFNAPFCRDPQRLSAKLVSALATRVGDLKGLLDARRWEFRCQDWRETLSQLDSQDFVYLDPPYFGRHADYFNTWSEHDARALAVAVESLPCEWALSDWLEDRTGVSNGLLAELYGHRRVLGLAHRYVIGATSASRGRMTEALVLSADA